MNPHPAAAVAFATAAPAATVEVSNVETDLAALVFTEQTVRRGFVHLVARRLAAAHTADVLPAGHELLLAFDNDSGHSHVAVVEGALVWLDSWRNGGRLRVAGADQDGARAVADALVAALRPTAAAGKVRVEFAELVGGSRHVEIDARPWSEISHLYPAALVASMDRLVDYEPGDDDPRLLLWHGLPGTGKTTAVRALLDAWREWTDPVVVSDPETLLADGRYLRRVLLDADDDDQDRWRLVVLEDAEALLQARGGGPLVGRLLNLADGLLGQGLRCLFLLTTNQTVDLIHPALVRPGRCLSLLGFGALSAAEASLLRGAPVTGAMTLAEVMSREVDVVEAPLRIGGYL
jgi:hypothetical protein